MLLLLGCVGGHVSVGDDTATRPRDTDPGDTDPVDTAAADTGAEDIGDNPDALAPTLRFDPPPGTFEGSVTVTVTVENGEARYTTDGSDPTTGRSVIAPLTFDGSTELRVVATNAGHTTYATATYLEVDASAADFTSNLPLVVLWADGSLPDVDDDYTPIALQIHDAAGGRASLLGEAAHQGRAAVRIRGSSTAYDPKHNYALELRGDADDEDDDRELLGMPADSDWVLYAPLDFDRALMRNALMYRLSEAVGRYAPRTRFVEVFEVERGGSVRADGYVGVYTLIERITRNEGRVDVAKLDPEDVAPPEVTGGYIFKRDRTGDFEMGFWAGDADGAFSFSEPLVNVYPQEGSLEREQQRYLADTIDAFADALADPSGVGPDGLSYADHADVASFIDHHFLNLYAKNPDALRLSAYMYKDREGPIVAGPLWDFDRAMGCATDDRAQDPTWWDATNQTSDTTDMWDYGWYAGLYSHAEYRTAYWARARELLEGPLAVAAVHAEIDAMAAELDEAAARNFQTWSAYGPRWGSYAAEVDHLKDWFAARHAWMTACLDAYPDAPELCPGD